MTVIIELPHVGESVTEGTISKWLKQVGDTVNKYDPLVEVETDKVSMDVPSPYTGQLTALLVKEGDTISMGTPIAEIETGELSDNPADPYHKETQAPDIGRIGLMRTDIRPVGPTGSGEETLNTNTTINNNYERHEPPTLEAHRTSQTPQGNRYSPVVRRLAAEQNVDLSQVLGTGIGGRITKADIQNYMAETSSPHIQGSQTSLSPAQETLPITQVRRLIAKNMVKSATQIPQAWSYQEVDVTSLVSLRQNIKEEFYRDDAVELTYLPFFIKAVAESLKEHYLINASWSDNGITVNKNINIGIAMATSRGLIVPVIHNADTLSIASLARISRRLTQRARDNKLSLDDIQGGTFTLNNTGALGSVASQPLVNPPQAAIITTESIVKRPVVITGDAIAVRSMMNICITFDHRILDGSEIGSFTTSVKSKLESIGPNTSIY